MHYNFVAVASTLHVIWGSETGENWTEITPSWFTKLVVHRDVHQSVLNMPHRIWVGCGLWFSSPRSVYMQNFVAVRETAERFTRSRVSTKHA